jgi:hypothetical protein
VVGIGWRKQLLVAAVEVDPIQAAEIRIAPFLADRQEIQHPILFVDPQELGDVAIAFRDLVLFATGPHIVQVQLPPVVAL